MDELYNHLKEFGKVKSNELLSKHTTFKIGGPAAYFVIIDELKNLVPALQYLDSNGKEYFILGGGSNLLVNDDGYDGVVIQVKHPQYHINGEEIVADAGCTTAQICQAATEAGLTGFEWGIGVPGTIGGAVRGNAGIPQAEMKDIVTKVETYQDSDVVLSNTEECGFGYRESAFQKNNAVVLRVWLKLTKGQDKEKTKMILSYITQRRQTQPQGFSAGCVFKNVKCENAGKIVWDKIPLNFQKNGKIPAGWLVEQVGMKGSRTGQAQVSEQHANFIINLGGATCQDVMSLIEEIKEKVYNTFGIELELEIKVI